MDGNVILSGGRDWWYRFWLQNF